MTGKLFLWLLAALLAWNLGDQLYRAALWLERLFRGWVPAPLFRGNSLASDKTSIDFYIALLCGTLVFWLLLKGVVGPVLKFLWPASQRFGATKPVRRIQGAFAELFLFAFFLAFLTCVAMIRNTAEAEITKEVAAEIADETIRKLLAPHEEQVQRLEGEVKTLTAQIMGPVIEAEEAYMEKLREINGWRPSGPYRPGLFQEIIPPPPPDVPYERAQRWAYNRQYNIEHYFGPLEQRIFGRRAIANEQSDRLVAAEQRLSEARRNLERTRNSVSTGKNSPLVQSAAQERARSQSLPWHFQKTFVYTWRRSFPWALALYLCATFFGKRPLAAVHNPIRRFLDAGRFGVGGSSRLATLFEEWPLRWKAGDGALFMGRSLYSRFLHISLKDDRHMLTIAGSRGGKGATAIIPNLLLWPGSALVIDPKGTNAAVTAQHRIAMGHSVHIVDPFDVLGRGETAAFNPLSMLDPESREIREQIALIADALVVPDQDAREKHWDEGARTVISGLIAHLITKYESPTLAHLRTLLSLDTDGQAELWTDMSLNDSAGGAAKDAGTRVSRGIGTTEISGILSNADKHTEWLASVPIQEALGTTTFAFAEMKETPTTIYLILPPHYLDTHNRFLRLFVNLAIKQMSIGGRSKVPVLMILDEFLALGYMAEVEKALGLMAGYNFVLWPFVQDLGRLKDLYKNSVNAFINNSRAVQVFAISDETTTKFVSDRIGEISISGSVGQPIRAVPFRTPTEAAKEVAFETECQYILRAGQPPLLLEKVRYYEDKGTDLQSLPPWLLRRLYPFMNLYGKDPDYDKA